MDGDDDIVINYDNPEELDTGGDPEVLHDDNLLWEISLKDAYKVDKSSSFDETWFMKLVQIQLKKLLHKITFRDFDEISELDKCIAKYDWALKKIEEEKAASKKDADASAKRFKVVIFLKILMALGQFMLGWYGSTIATLFDKQILGFLTAAGLFTWGVGGGARSTFKQGVKMSLSFKSHEQLLSYYSTIIQTNKTELLKKRKKLLAEKPSSKKESYSIHNSYISCLQERYEY